MSTIDWKEHAEQLEEKLKHAKEIVRETEVALRTARLKVFGLFKGCRVRSTKTGTIYQFAEMYYWSVYVNRPWIKGRKKNKDGEWSKTTVNLYGDWEITKDG